MASQQFRISIREHRFYPDTIEVKVNEPFELEITNEDNTAEEFESHDLRKEKLIGPKKTIKMKIPSLKAGEYRFFGEFNESTAQGKIIVQ